MTKVLFGIGFDMLFSELYKTMVNKVPFLNFRMGYCPPLNPPLFRGSIGSKNALFWQCFFFTHASFRHVTNLGHQGVRRVFWEKPKIFELCPIVLNFVLHVFPGETKNIPTGASPPCAPRNGPGFFTHSINQGWANLFNGRVICRKPKTPASRKTSL